MADAAPCNPAAPMGAAAWKIEARATVSLAGPMVLTQLSQIAILTTDVVMIGRLGKDPLAAATLGVSLIYVLLVLSIGVVTATAPLAAQAYGARRPRDVRRVIRQGLWVAIALGVPSSAILVYGRDLLLAVGQIPAVAAEAQTYLDGLLWTVVPVLGFVVLRNFVSALGRPKPALWVMLAGVPLNAVLNYALIFGNFGLPRLELFGAGLASVIVNTAMFALMMAIALTARPFRRYNLLGRFWRPDWPRFRRIFVVGTPIGGIMLLEAGVFSGAAFLMGWISTTALAAHQVALQIAAVTFMVPFGIAQAATVRVGHAVGRRDPVGARRAGWTAIVMGMAFMGCMGIVFILARTFLASLFLGADAPGRVEVIEMASGLLLVAALFQLVDGAQAIGAGALRGLNDTAVPMVYAALGYWGIGFASGYLLAFEAGLGSLGIWIGLALGLAVVAVLMLWRFRRLTQRGYLPPIARDLAEA